MHTGNIYDICCKFVCSEDENVDDNDLLNVEFNEGVWFAGTTAGFCREFLSLLFGCGDGFGECFVDFTNW